MKKNGYPIRRNRVHEVLNGKRRLTMAIAWKLRIGLGIPAESQQTGGLAARLVNVAIAVRSL